VQRATAQSKTVFFHDYGVAEAPPGFQAGWSDCMYLFSLFLFIMFARLGFPWTVYKEGHSGYKNYNAATCLCIYQSSPPWSGGR
jgi:hypothetical protein